MALASKIDQGRSLFLRAPQGCLRLNDPTASHDSFAIEPRILA
jgi:hypothetical protein